MKSSSARLTWCILPTMTFKRSSSTSVYATLALSSLIGGTVLFTACSSDPAAKPADAGASSDGALVGDARDTPPTTEPGVSVIGRAELGDGMTAVGTQMSWPGVQIRVKFKGTEVRGGFTESTAPGFQPLNLTTVSEYLVIVDDKVEKTLQLKDGTAPNSDLEFWKGADGEHTLVIYRKTESRFGRTTFNGFTFPNGGMVLPIERPGRKLLFIGDSITAGYGADKSGPYDPATSENPSNPMATCPPNLYRQDASAPTNAQIQSNTQALIGAENAYVSFAANVGRTLKADTQLVALSGVGMARSRNPDEPTIDKLYNRVGGEITSRVLADSSWQPDAVVLNIGTNDFAGGDPGAVFQVKLEEFTKKLREEFPAAVIVLMIGPMVQFDQKIKLVEYVSTTKTNLDMAGDKKIRVVEVTQNATKVGCEYHPTADTHQAMAASVGAEVRAALGWK
jgi:lysophospholipase L1-like esterase